MAVIDRDIGLHAFPQRRRMGTSANGDKSMPSEVVELSHARNAESGTRTSSFIPRWDGSTAVSQEPVEINKDPERDAYLLLLLADQELTAGRSEQALTLVDAAYNAFDGRSEEP